MVAAPPPIAAIENCGSCGNDCTIQLPNATPACDFGACVIDSCDSGFDDCDDEAAGCETDIKTNPSHCGGCNQACGDTNALAVNCNMGTCAPTCEANWCPAANPANGCTAPKGTTSNCTACGDVCEGETPFCTPEGCRAYLPIAVINDATTETATTRDLVFDHVLETSAADNNYRMVVLLLGNKASPNNLPDGSVTYGGEPMTRVRDRYDNQAWSGIYSILSDDLPPTAGTYTVSVLGDNQQQRWAARVVELINVNQVTPFSDGGWKNHGGEACSNADARVSLATKAGAWVVSVLTEARTLGESTAPTGDNLSPWSVLTTNQSVVSQGHTTATGTTTNVSWNNCSATTWVHLAAAFLPMGCRDVGPSGPSRARRPRRRRERLSSVSHVA